ncbi:MAG: DUF4097 family beta strand repeat-containing protein [Defluviitaleaceae bacterium]|nr:DUF4097 family beta strand repeat-containing protein [Defluviitaleaceae bacterium]
MDNEKMKILKMLEEGKITSNEAARLLESVGTGGSAGYDRSRPDDKSYSDYSGSSSPAGNGSRSDGRNREVYGEASPRSSGYSSDGEASPRSSAYSSDSGRGSQSSADSRRAGRDASGRIEDFTSDLGKKFDSFARDMEPRLQKFTDRVAEKTVAFADRISKSFPAESAPRPSNPGGAYRPSGSGADGAYRPSGPSSGGPAIHVPGTGTERDFELQVAPGYNELSLAGVNGNVIIRGYNGDKITAKVFFKARRGVPASREAAFMRLGNKYFLNYEEDDFEKVEIDAYVPEGMFNVVSIRGANGDVDISTLKAERIEISNANGPVKLKELNADAITVDCSNGPLSLTRISAETAEIENFNGLIDAFDLDVSGLKMQNTNGGVTINVSSLTKYADYVWSVETSNGKLTANLPTMPDLGYHLKACNTLGSVKVGMTGLTYMVNEANSVEAKSFIYDKSPKKARLAFETSNGPLVVN